MGYYHCAQICLNGHCISARIDDCPEHDQRYCHICGAETIMACPKCNAFIRGDHEVEGVIAFGFPYPVPAYCHNCGKPYPWTEAALEVARSLIEDDENIDKSDCEKLEEVLCDILTETPKTRLAVTRLKKFLSIAGKFTADGIRQFVIDFGCEFVKQSLGMK